MTTTVEPESLTEALTIAETVSANYGSWKILSTRSGGFQLRWVNNGTWAQGNQKAAIINFMTKPCRLNHAEADKPYQVWRRNDYQNWSTLAEAVADAIKL